MNAKANTTAWDISPEGFPADGAADQKLVFLLNFAILAPSSHNTQPWLFRVKGHELEVLADFSRSLPIIDPVHRELIMSCGAALQHLQVAARHFGCDTRVEFFPEPGEPSILARLELGLQTETTAEDILLFNAILKRRTNRLPFLPDPVPASLLEILQATAAQYGCWLHLISDDESRFRVADLVSEADRVQWHDKEFRRELAGWLTPNNTQRRDGMPGYSHGKGDLASQAEPLMVRTFDLGKGQAARDHDVALYSPMLAVLGTETDSQGDWLQAGQALSAILLRARVEDVWGSFLNQVVEVPQTRTALGELAGRGGISQILLRLGFAPEVKPTPRRSVKQVLLKARDTPIRIH